MTFTGHLRPNLYDVPVEARTSRPLGDLLSYTAKPSPPANTPKLKPTSRRVRIWEINTNLHCSIIGTCMSAAELRRLLGKLKVRGIDTADEHELHMLGVLLAARPLEGGKLLHKALDRRHHVALNQFSKAKDDAAIAALWDKAFGGGDVAGAYWALLTHPESSDKLVQKAFGDIHMMSHLMGATNCADLRRMRQLEEEVAALTAKLERQQKHLRDGFVERDEQIARLSSLLSDRMQADVAETALPDESHVAALKMTVSELGDRLARETSRRERLEQRLAAFESSENARRRAESERDALRHELALIEDRIGGLPITGGAATAVPDLVGIAILYVGGRAHQIPRLKALVEQAGGRFVHHDGGVEEAAALLPGLISRSDVTMFPVDCVSHNAMNAAKRTCQQLNKRFVPLRTTSATCLLAALTALPPSTEATPYN